MGHPPTVTGQPAIVYTYDDANRLTLITQGSSNTGIGYDNDNRRSTLTLPNGIVLTYGYDTGSRLTSMSYQLGVASVGNLTYGYDVTDRRTQMGGSLARTGFPSAVSSAVYDVANELTNWNGTTIGYDSNGNVQNDGTSSYVWDARNQLASRAGVGFQYDSRGRRTQNASGNKLLYDRVNAAQEITGATPTANLLTGGVDEFFSRSDANGMFVPLTDGLGSVLALTNATGSIQTQYTFEPFGKATSAGQTSGNTFQYTGRENDGTGLYFYRDRYYNPTYGRFISEDPTAFGGGDTNLYAYVSDSPTNFNDPTGDCKIDINFRPVGFGAYHSYIVFSDPDGKQWYFGGFPEHKLPAGDEDTAVVEDWFSHKDHGFGKLLVLAGRYTASLPDYGRATNTVRVLDNNDSCRRYFHKFAATAHQISEGSDYNAWDNNSNTATSRALSENGYHPTPPVYVPGWIDGSWAGEAPIGPPLGGGGGDAH